MIKDALGIAAVVAIVLSVTDIAMEERAQRKELATPQNIDTFAHSRNSAVPKKIGVGIDSAVARTKDSMQIAKIIPQAKPAQVSSVLNLRLGR